MQGGMKFNSTLHNRESSTQYNKYQVSHKDLFFSWWWVHSRPKHVDIDKYIKNKYNKHKLYIKLSLFTRLQQLYLGTRNWIIAQMRLDFFLCKRKKN